MHGQGSKRIDFALWNGRGITLFDGDFSKGMLLALAFPVLLIVGVMAQNKNKCAE